VTDANKQVEDDLLYKDMYDNVVVAKYEMKVKINLK